MTNNTMAYQPTSSDDVSAALATAHQNVAISALLDGIRAQLVDCATATWADAASAQSVARDLLHLYASVSGKDSGDTFDLPFDGHKPVTFTLEDF